MKKIIGKRSFSRKNSCNLWFSPIFFVLLRRKIKNQDDGSNCNKKETNSRRNPCVAGRSPSAQGCFPKRNERMVAGTATKLTSFA